MNYTIQQLQADVMSRIGEMASAISLPSAAGIPEPADIIALKAEGMLPEVGAKLLRDAPPDMLGEGTAIAATAAVRLMPCGLYAAEVPLPEDFVRFVSAKMEGWERSAGHIISSGDAEWGCQWSAEAGIAGCAARPRAYMAEGPEGRMARLIGSDDPADAVEWLRGWRIPKGSAFSFPEPLYPALVAEIANLIHDDCR